MQTLEISSYCIPFRIPGSQGDRKALHYFCIQASSDLSGYILSDFWNRFALQRSHDEPTVRQALVALCALHFEYVSTEPDNGRSGAQNISPHTLSLYIKAVSKLRRYLDSDQRPSRAVALSCCAIFFSFELLRGDHGPALAHLRNGMAILEIWRSEVSLSAGETTGSDSELKRLEEVFSRLDLQATIYNDTRTPLLTMASRDERSGKQDCVNTAAFASIDDAQTTLDKLLNWAFHFLTANSKYKFMPLCEVPPAVVQERFELVTQFRRWSVTLDGFSSCTMQQPSMSPTEHLVAARSVSEGSTLLKIHHRSAQMLLDSCLAQANFYPNEFDDGGKSVLEMSRPLIKKAVSLSAISAVAARRSFSSELGVVAPLFLLAIKTSDPDIREEAISLIAASGRREGLYDSHGIVEIFKKLTEPQQLSSCVDLEDTQRTDTALRGVSLRSANAELIDTATGDLKGMAKMLNMNS
ncbi:hypothetical protein LTR50_004815 [Elasticomyces elasticus]|nr:hypothetical protein LTR50_004815 [Elasticomyces elasticus]